MVDSGSYKSCWRLDAAVTYLNHGAYGACPTEVLAKQRELQDQLERQPVRFMQRERLQLLQEARAKMAEFVGADPQDAVFVNNATAGVNAVLRSLSFQAGDELLTTNHTYPACRYVLDHVSQLTGARIVVAQVPFPLIREDEVVDAIAAQITPRTKLALIDHVTSPTGLVLPIARIAARLKTSEVPLLVDGAHAPGMVAVDLNQLSEAGVGYYAANVHKWVCTPKGVAMLWVRRDLQEQIVPGVISHGYGLNSGRYQALFDWTGTEDPSGWLSFPFAVQYMGWLGGGWSALRRRNRELALLAREVLCEALDVAAPAPASMIGSLAAVPLPDGEVAPNSIDPLQSELLDRHGYEVLVCPWPNSPRRVLRVSAQLYNTADDYRRLANQLRQHLALG